MENPGEKLAKKLAARTKLEKDADPHGFHEMTERELIDWMGAGHAQPGSQVFEHAKLVLESKQNHRLLHQGLNSEPYERPELEEPELPKLTGIHIGVVTLIVAVCGIVAATVPMPVVKFVAVLFAVVALAALLVRPLREPTLRLVDRMIA